MRQIAPTSKLRVAVAIGRRNETRQTRRWQCVHLLWRAAGMSL